MQVLWNPKKCTFITTLPPECSRSSSSLRPCTGLLVRWNKLYNCVVSKIGSTVLYIRDFVCIVHKVSSLHSVNTLYLRISQFLLHFLTHTFSYTNFNLIYLSLSFPSWLKHTFIGVTSFLQHRACVFSSPSHPGQNTHSSESLHSYNTELASFPHLYIPTFRSTRHLWHKHFFFHITLSLDPTLRS